MAKEMLINTVEGQECRIAILENGALEELYIERASSASQVGNIYKGRVTNVEPSIQAAFIDFGGLKNGFLHISDVNPQYFGGKKSYPTEAVGRKRPHRDRPPIQECLRRGQEVVVQMTKEGIGTKGPTLTTYLSIPGRMLVMMPGMSRLGVSRKIEDEDARSKARKALNELKLPGDMGFIVRTAGIDRPKRELQRDLNYLLRLWKTVEERTKRQKAPSEIYKESDLVIRTIRDVYNSDIDRIICDREDVATRVKEFLEISVPRTKHAIELYTGDQGLFHDFDLESEIEKIYSRRVELKSGGSIVIDQTEALVAIDVNSGRFRQHKDAERTAVELDLEATDEILRQLRLRDLGGMVVIDYIDVRDDKSKRAIERALRNGLKKDRAKTKVLRMSAFGLVEMTRQRVRPSLKHSIYRDCKYCNGMGLIKSDESQALMVMRILKRVMANDDVTSVEVGLTPESAEYLANYHRTQIAAMEAETQKKVIVRGDPELAGHDLKFTCHNARGSVVAWEPLQQDSRRGQKPRTVRIEDYLKQRKQPADQPAEPTDEPQEPTADQATSDVEKDAEESKPAGEKKSSKRRGRRGGRRRKKGGDKDKGDRDESPEQAKVDAKDADKPKGDGSKPDADAPQQTPKPDTPVLDAPADQDAGEDHPSQQAEETQAPGESDQPAPQVKGDSDRGDQSAKPDKGKSRKGPRRRSRRGRAKKASPRAETGDDGGERASGDDGNASDRQAAKDDPGVEKAPAGEAEAPADEAGQEDKPKTPKRRSRKKTAAKAKSSKSRSAKGDDEGGAKDASDKDEDAGEKPAAKKSTRKRSRRKSTKKAAQSSAASSGGDEASSEAGEDS